MSDKEAFYRPAAGMENSGISVQTKSRRIGCANSKWTVYLDHIVDQFGNEVPDYIVVGGTVSRPDKITGVCVLPVVDDRIGLIQYYRHAVEETLWEVPRGFVDAGEAPDIAAHRELKEETGLTCDPADLVALGYYLPEPSTLEARGGVFAATRCKGAPMSGDGEIGLGNFALFTKAQVRKMAQDSEIQDASTLIALYRYFSWCKNRQRER